MRAELFRGAQSEAERSSSFPLEAGLSSASGRVMATGAVQVQCGCKGNLRRHPHVTRDL